jgi:uncharacterized protein YndB with AHSA1/START domain
MTASNPDERSTLTLTKIIPATPQVVFQAWLEPRALAKFMCPAEGVTIAKVETDPRVGGKFLIVMKVGDQELPHHGEYRVIERFQRLVFSWHSAMAGPESQVSLRFEELSASETKLTLEHIGLDSAVARDKHEQGWTNILSALARST